MWKCTNGTCDGSSLHFTYPPYCNTDFENFHPTLKNGGIFFEIGPLMRDWTIGERENRAHFPTGDCWELAGEIWGLLGKLAFPRVFSGFHPTGPPCFHPQHPVVIPPSSQWNEPSRFRAGWPAPAVGRSGANSGHGPPFATLRPPLSRGGPVRPAANARCRAKSTSAGRVADPLIYQKDHPCEGLTKKTHWRSIQSTSTPSPVFHPPGSSVATGRHASGQCPTPAVGHSVEMLRHGLRISHFGPPCHGRPSCRTANRRFALRARGVSAMESHSSLPRGRTALLADVRGVCWLKTNSSGTSWRGRAPLRGVPSGAYWLSARRPRAGRLKSERQRSSP